ncbi:PKD domain-containing protein [Ferruginibacter paludis]|uniref:PKD domain-containing protein n=1 Tax=Ferruginibacter paludis TaxID=1310417 RepID=UPI0025B37D6D|nr:PKD domain-containing protein [Ferruginibacter paludis]MDN3656468.1 PKD domain-containing protein [Ferruginibacter paludis]
MPSFRTARHNKPVLLFTLIILLYCANATAQLTADFTLDKSNGCAPLAVNFTNTSSGASAAAIYTWDFDNGNSAFIANPGAIFIEEKTYNVTLTVSDGSFTSSKTKQVTVNTPPLADFTVSPVKGCLPVTVNFNATTTQGSNLYTWDFGDGNTQQGYNSATAHTYTIPQKVSVSLTVGNSYGCTKTIQKDNILTILPAISAVFGASRTFLCRVTDAVEFTNTSYGPGTLTYLWDFGDGTTSTVITPSHTFKTKGTFTVTLTVTSSEGCAAVNTQSGYINVDNFKTDFTVPSLICQGFNIVFNNTSTPIASTTEWFVDGVPAYAYYYDNSLNYNFAVTGAHTIELKNTFGSCRDSASKKAVINEVPNLNGFITNKTSECNAPVKVNFKDTTASAVKWEWNFNQYYLTDIQSVLQAPSYTYINNGDHYISLRVTNAAGCTSTANQYVSITGPYVSITSNGTAPTCGPYSLKFTTTSSDSIIQYNWNFGDGNFSTEAQPSHLFNTGGYWPVTLTYKTKTGCSGTATYGTVAVYLMPKANFSAGSTTICGNSPVTFNAVYQGADTDYYWDFGDNNYPGYNYGSSPTHQYLYDSTYTVTLIVANRGNCRDTITRTNYIKVLPPFPRITSQANTCAGTRGMVTFTQESKKANTWTWDFGDGITKTFFADSPSVNHVYNATGSYKAVLINTNGQCTVRDSIYTKVLLKQTPLLTASATQVCSDGNVHIQISKLQNNPAYPSYDNHYNFEKLEYNDGSAFTGYIVRDNDSNYYWSNSFKGTLGNFSTNTTALRIILRSSSFQCPDTTNFIPLAIKGSKAGFEVVTDNVCFKLPIVLKDTSNTNNKIVSWQWNFGDGAVETVAQGGLVRHTYSNPGYYYVSLTVVDASGCSTTTPSYSQYVTVNGPKATFYPSTTNTYITLPVYFYNNTNNYNSNNTQYKWQFGDGISSSDYSPQHTYQRPGQYTVQLITTNPDTGCTDTTSQVIIVSNFIPIFTFDKMYLTGAGCPPVLVKMTNNSTNYTSVKWDFGDGTSADNLNYPGHIYEQPGKYIITLYVYGPSGLTGTFKDSLLIQLPQGGIKTNKKEGCIGLTPTFTITTKNALAYVWDYGDGTIVSNGNLTTNHQYNHPGSFIPLMVLTDSNGCSAFAPLADTILVHPDPVIKVIPQDPRICRGQQLNITASGGSFYSWSPAIGLSNASIASPAASPSVTTTYTVTVKDNIGCSSSAAQKITVVQPGKLTAGSNAAVCLGKSVQINVAGAAFYQWINNTAGLSNTSISNPVASPLQTTSYTVTGTDEYKCFSDTAIIKIAVLALPTVSVAQVPDILLGTQIPLNSTSSSDVITWNWMPADYLSCSDCPSPVSTPLAQKNYTLTVTNSNGCSASAEVILKLQCQENRVFIPAAFSPNGDGKNDVFNIRGISVVKHLIVYNRWGAPVFERHNFIASERSAGWDGTFRGEPLPVGTYAYFAQMECPSGRSFNRNGTVVLVR